MEAFEEGTDGVYNSMMWHYGHFPALTHFKAGWLKIGRPVSKPAACHLACFKTGQIKVYSSIGLASFKMDQPGPF